MSKCDHVHISITEMATATTWHYYENGTWMHDSDYGEYTGALVVHCNDCGMEKYYSPSQVPQWLQHRLQEALKHKTESQL